MLEKFRTYQLALRLNRDVREVRLPGYLRDQLQRACLSVCLNLAEGSAKQSKKERLRFYGIAFASLREVQALIDIEGDQLSCLWQLADHLGACLFRLTQQ